MYACGLRIGEAATVEIASVDSASLLLRVIGKGDKERRVPLPDAFVIPGGTAAAAALDVARAVLRRAERRIVGLQQGGQLRNPEVLRYTNRLSDLLFMLARAEEGTAVKPLMGRRVARRPPAPARTRPAPRRRPRA